MHEEHIFDNCLNFEGMYFYIQLHNEKELRHILNRTSQVIRYFVGTPKIWINNIE